MARARSPNSIEAEKLYNSGMKLVDIAKKLGVPAGTVRRWKSTQGWGDAPKKKESERSEIGKGKKANVRKRGAPAGNKNAVGHGAPKRNQNAVKHGAYCAVFADTMTDEENELLANIDDSEEQQLIMELQLITIRERRLLQRIKNYEEQSQRSKGLLIKGVKRTSTAKYDGKADIKSSNKQDINAEITETSVTDTEAAMESIMKIEAELTKVQRAKTKIIDSLMHYRLQWKQAGGIPDQQDDVQIYLPDNNGGD